MDLQPGQRIGLNLEPHDVMIIDSQITDWEEDKGYCKPSGHVDKFLKRAGITDFYYTNVVKTWYPKEYKVKKRDIQIDSPLIQQELDIVKPKYVLLFGAIAVEFTIGGKITKQMGQIIEKDGIKFLPCLNPGIIFRDPSKEPLVIQAMDKFREMLDDVPQEKAKLNIKLLKSVADIDEAFRYLKKKKYKYISFDIETTGTDRFTDKVNAIGFGNDKIQYELILDLPFSPLENKRLASKKLAFYLVKKLSDSYFKLIAGNGKFDVLFLWLHYNTRLFLYWDVVQSSHILDENNPNDVESNAQLKCNAHNWDIPLPHKKGEIESQEMFDEYVEYLGYDIYYEYLLYKVDSKEVKKDRAIYNLFMELVMPAIRSYQSIERHGIFVRQEKFEDVRKYLNNELNRVHKQLRKHKKVINWNSSQQVGDYLYKELKLPVLEKTATGNPATGQDVIRRIQDKHEVIPLIIEYKGIFKQVSSFIDGWKKLMVDGRLHANFKMLTVTGRTSCTEPNLQQVPRDPRIRSLLGAPPGRAFVELDGSQMELRFAGIISGDTELLHAYHVGIDVHTKTYEQVSGKKLSKDPQIATEERKKAKATNFGEVKSHEIELQIF